MTRNRIVPRTLELLRRKAEIAEQRGDKAAAAIATARFWQYWRDGEPTR